MRNQANHDSVSLIGFAAIRSRACGGIILTHKVGEDYYIEGFRLGKPAAIIGSFHSLQPAMMIEGLRDTIRHAEGSCRGRYLICLSA